MNYARLVVIVLLFTSSSAWAQLSVADDLHPQLLQVASADLGAAAGAKQLVVRPPVTANWQPTTSNRQLAPGTRQLATVLRQTAPHLAFFCRLEINEKAGGKIPAKFRLGGHRYWQDNLLRR